jgi:chromosomal replication initiation ATPase DnaA
VIRIIHFMHLSPENEPLGLVEEAQRRREHYARYIERRVEEALERPATAEEIERQVERRVHERIAAEINRRANERLAKELWQIWRYDVPQGPPIGEILRAVARAAGVTAAELAGPRRHSGLVEARHVAVLLVCELRPDLSLPAIARAFAGLDLEGIVEARKRARRRLADPASDSARWHAAAEAALQGALKGGR